MKNLLKMSLGVLSLIATCLLPTVAGATDQTYTATQTFNPPSANFTGANGGGDGWGVAATPTRVFNVFHHNTILGLMCHNQSDASACWNSTDTGSSNLYKTITATVGGATATFATSGEAGMYLDTRTGLLYVYAARDDGSYAQPGVVCIDTNAADTVTDPVCSGTNGQPAAWTPLTVGTTDRNHVNGFTDGGGSLSPTFYNGKLYSFNPFVGAVASPGGTGSSGKNALLCYDVVAQAPCAGEPYAVNVGSTTAVYNGGTPGTADTLVAGHYFIPTTFGTAKLVCVDLTGAQPANCTGAWPLSLTNTNVAAIPSLDSTGTPTGVCAEASALWHCYNFAGAAATTPSNLTNANLTESAGWNGSPVVVATKVLMPNYSNNSATCFDFATNGECTGTSHNFPVTFSGLSTLYTLNIDPARPTCLWVNADSGSSQIQNLDVSTGGSCANAPIQLNAASVVAPYSACVPSHFSTINVVATNHVYGTNPSPTVTFANSNGVPTNGPYAITPGTPLDLTTLTYNPPIVLSTISALPQFIINLYPTAALGTVTVTVTWVGSNAAQCQPGYVAPSAITSSASGITDTSATLNGTLTNAGTDVLTSQTICYQTTAFISGGCTGTNGTATAGTVSGNQTPYSLQASLAPGTTYYFELTASDTTTGTTVLGGVQSFTTTGNPIPPVTYNTPTQPLNALAILNGTTANISWNWPIGNGNMAITGYQVTSTPGGYTCYSAVNSSCYIDGLTIGVTYVFDVVAINAIGPSPSARTNAVTPLGPPSAVNNLTLNISGAQATLNWTVPSSNGGTAITSYFVMDQSGATVCSGLSLSCVVPEHANTAAFLVWAANIVGPGPLTPISATATASSTITSRDLCTVFFAEDSYVISSSANATLQACAMQIVAGHFASLTLTGSTDLLASVAYNMTLSRNRAMATQAVLKRDLASLHYSAAKFAIVPMGISRQYSALAPNRRVTVSGS